MGSEWREVRFSEAVLVNPAVKLKRSAIYPFVDMNSISPGIRDVAPIDMRYFAGGGSRFVDGDTLMARITPCLENGKIARYTAADQSLPAHGSTEFVVLRSKPGVSDPGYVFYMAIWDEVTDYAIAHMTGSSGRQRFPSEAFDRLLLPLPPLREQQAIAGVLGALDDKIAANRRLAATLEALARRLFRSWFVDFDPAVALAAGRRPVGLSAAAAGLFPRAFADSPLGPVPAGWRVDALPNAIEVNPTRRLRVGTVAPYADMGNMPTTSARILDWVPRAAGSGARFCNGDVLVARITPCLENGKTALVDFLEDGQIGWGSTEYIVLRGKPPLSPEFTYLLARTDEFRSHAIANMTGSSGRQRVPAESLGNYFHCAPPAEVVKVFDGIVRPLFRALKAHDEQSRALASLRDALLPRLLSGELRVRDADITTNEVA